MPAQWPGSSWLLIAVQTELVHVWHTPGQSLRLTQPRHWLVVVSQIEAAPVQCLFAVQATHRPLLVSHARVPNRPAQSVSEVHFAHRWLRQSGLCDGQSLSVAQVPAASIVGPMRATSGAGASGEPSAAGASGTVATGASGGAAAGIRSGSEPSSTGPVLAGASGVADTGGRSGSPPSCIMAGPPAASVKTGPSTPTAPSAVAGLSTATEPSAPPSTSRMHFQSAVHVYPVWHWSWGEHTLQSRSTQESPDVAGRTSASIRKHTTRWLVMSEVLGY